MRGARTKQGQCDLDAGIYCTTVTYGQWLNASIEYESSLLYITTTRRSVCVKIPAAVRDTLGLLCRGESFTPQALHKTLDRPKS